MKNELDVVRDISAKFDELGIPFMLTGSMALNYHAQPRMTRDIDVVVALNQQDLPRLIERFEPEYYVAAESAREAVSRESVFNLIHQESVIKVDCIVRKSSEYRRVEFDRRVAVTIAGFRTYITSKEDLILSKLVWAKDSRSELQLRDVKNLLATGYNREYTETWAEELTVADLLTECLGK